MRSTYIYIFLFLLVCAGCSSSRRDVTDNSPSRPPDRIVPEPAARQEAEQQPASTDPLLDARKWTPRFIPTGFASGIMVEFTGIKQGAKLNARYAGIELQRMIPDTSLPSTLKLTATINDLRQAFFKVRPGLYFLRQTKAWAEQSSLREVEVRDGNYSVMTIEVINPRPQKIQPLSDSNDTK